MGKVEEILAKHVHRYGLHSDDFNDMTPCFCDLKPAIETLLTKRVIQELQDIPNFEVEDEPGNAAQYIIDRIAQLKAEPRGNS